MARQTLIYKIYRKIFFCNSHCSFQMEKSHKNYLLCFWLACVCQMETFSDYSRGGPVSREHRLLLQAGMLHLMYRICFLYVPTVVFQWRNYKLLSREMLSRESPWTSVWTGGVFHRMCSICFLYVLTAVSQWRNDMSSSMSILYSIMNLTSWGGVTCVRDWRLNVTRVWESESLKCFHSWHLSKGNAILSVCSPDFVSKRSRVLYCSAYVTLTMWGISTTCVLAF